MSKIPRVTRRKLLKALRAFQDFQQEAPNRIVVLVVEALVVNENSEESGANLVNVNLRSEYPSYEYLAREIYGGRDVKDGPFTFKAPVGIIRDEIQRMVNDGLVTVGMQSTGFWMTDEANGEEYQFDPGRVFDSEEIRDFKTKITLTTKGKSVWGYWTVNFAEHAVSWFALLVSIAAFTVSLFK